MVKQVFTRSVGLTIGAAFFLTNAAVPYAQENTFWEGRRGATKLAHHTAAATPGFALLSQMPAAAKVPLAANIPADARFDWLTRAAAAHGTVGETYLSPKIDAPVVIHIQDAHGIEEAQRNISGLVSQLAGAAGVQLVGVEGAAGRFDFSRYRSERDPSITQNVADFFLRKGFITGAEFAGITASKPFTVLGLEGLGLYNQNIDAVKASARTKPAALAMWADLDGRAHHLAAKIFSPPLKEFDRRFAGYKEGAEKLGPYARYLLTTANENGVKVSTKNVRRLVKALGFEESLDFEAVETERLALVRALVAKLPKAPLEELVQKSLACRAGALGFADYHAYLGRLCAGHGIDMGGYSGLTSYIAYVTLADSIDRSGLVSELAVLEKSIPLSLARSAQERRLVAARQNVALLEKLFGHAMVMADWREYQTRRGAILAMSEELEALGAPTGQRPTPETLRPFEDFCRLAVARNDALASNLLQGMTSRGAKTAVLLAGGFHSEGLSQILRSKEISHLIITPKVSAIPKDSDYLDILARDPMPMEQLFSGDRIFVVRPLVTAPHAEGSAQGTADLMAADVGVLDTGKPMTLGDSGQTVDLKSNRPGEKPLATIENGPGTTDDVVVLTSGAIGRARNPVALGVKSAGRFFETIRRLWHRGLRLTAGFSPNFLQVWRRPNRAPLGTRADNNAADQRIEVLPSIPATLSTMMGTFPFLTGYFGFHHTGSGQIARQSATEINARLADFEKAFGMPTQLRVYGETVPGFAAGIVDDEIFGRQFAGHKVPLMDEHDVDVHFLTSFLYERVRSVMADRVRTAYQVTDDPVLRKDPLIAAYFAAVRERSMDIIEHITTVLNSQLYQGKIDGIAEDLRRTFVTGGVKERSAQEYIATVLELHGNSLSEAQRSRLREIMADASAKAFGEADIEPLVQDVLDRLGALQPFIVLNSARPSDIATRTLATTYKYSPGRMSRVQRFILVAREKLKAWKLQRLFGRRILQPLPELPRQTSSPAATMPGAEKMIRRAMNSLAGTFPNAGWAREWNSLSDQKQLDRIIRVYAPFVESFFVGVTYWLSNLLVAWLLPMVGLDPGLISNIGLFSAVNVGFGLAHTRVYRFDPETGEWKLSEAKTSIAERLGIAAIGLVVHSPLLLSLLNPVMAPLALVGGNAAAAAAAGFLHRGYNLFVRAFPRLGLPALTLGKDTDKRSRAAAGEPPKGYIWGGANITLVALAKMAPRFVEALGVIVYPPAGEDGLPIVHIPEKADGMNTRAVKLGLTARFQDYLPQVSRTARGADSVDAIYPHSEGLRHLAEKTVLLAPPTDPFMRSHDFYHAITLSFFSETIWRQISHITAWTTIMRTRYPKASALPSSDSNLTMSLMDHIEKAVMDKHYEALSNYAEQALIPAIKERQYWIREALGSISTRNMEDTLQEAIADYKKEAGVMNETELIEFHKEALELLRKNPPIPNEKLAEVLETEVAHFEALHGRWVEGDGPGFPALSKFFVAATGTILVLTMGLFAMDPAMAAPFVQRPDGNLGAMVLPFLGTGFFAGLLLAGSTQFGFDFWKLGLGVRRKTTLAPMDSGLNSTARLARQNNGTGDFPDTRDGAGPQDTERRAVLLEVLSESVLGGAVGRVRFDQPRVVTDPYWTVEDLGELSQKLAGSRALGESAFRGLAEQLAGHPVIRATILGLDPAAFKQSLLAGTARQLALAGEDTVHISLIGYGELSGDERKAMAAFVTARLRASPPGAKVLVTGEHADLPGFFIKAAGEREVFHLTPGTLPGLVVDGQVDYRVVRQWVGREENKNKGLSLAEGAQIIIWDAGRLLADGLAVFSIQSLEQSIDILRKAATHA